MYLKSIKKYAQNYNSEKFINHILSFCHNLLIMPKRTGPQHSHEFSQAIQKEIAESRSSRPENTKKAYNGKQEEFRQFCLEKQYPDGDLVSEGKLLLFLRENIIPRGNKRKKHTEGSIPLGIKSIESYISAICDLFKVQVSTGQNKNTNPRGVSIKSLTESMKRSEWKRKRDLFVDRCSGTLKDGYEDGDLENLSDYWMQQDSSYGLRNRFDFLVGHAMITRGENRRAMQFPDLFTLVLENEGPQVCTALLVLIDKGKTNQTSRNEYGACLRNSNVKLCAIGSLSFYLFWRWNMENEGFPDLSCRQFWYNKYVLKGSSANEQMQYTTQLNGVKKAFKACNIQSSNYTHSVRPSAVNKCAIEGVEMAQTRIAGRWSNGTMESVYLQELPRQAMRVLSGWPVQGGNYFLPCASISPPESLITKVFPRALEWKKTIEENNDTDISRKAFIELLLFLQIVFLQDAALLIKMYPNHKLFCHPLFKSDDFFLFSR